MSDPQIQPLDTRSIADYLADGMSVAEIAALTGQNEAVVAVLAENPLTQYLLKQAEARAARYRAEDGTFDPEKALAAETAATFEKLVELRDTAEKSETQLSAAKELFDRQRPKITRTEEERTVRITISKDDVAAAATIEAEMATIEAEFEKIEKITEKETSDA